MPQYMSNDKFRLALPWHKRASLALFGHGNGRELAKGGATESSRIAAGEVATYLKYRKDQAARVDPRVYSSTSMSHFNSVIQTVNIDAAALARFAPMKGDLWLVIAGIAGTDASRMRGESREINIFVVCDDSEHRKLKKVEIVTRTQPGGSSSKDTGLWLSTVYANGAVDQPAGRARSGARYGR
ncbi:hypothetical protein [Robbsia betulipollinis]|nr:hypothetical protein [Robbsia betulipollinis]